MTSGSEVEDQVGLARAYNQSIYLMLSVPFVAVSLVSWMVYRQLQVRAAYMASLSPGQEQLSRAPGAISCSAILPDAPSSPPPPA